MDPLEMATRDALLDALSSRFFARRVVRDLLWAVASPHLIDEARFPVLPVGFGLGASAATAPQLVEWLRGLETDPTPLVVFLQAKTNTKTKALALGTYFASLLEYWLRFCPLLRVDKFELSKQIVSSTQQTLGQLKFLFRVLRDDADFDDFHVESSVKFFLLHPLDDQFKRHGDSDDTAGLAQATYPLEQFVGPHLGENLAWRVQEVARKLDMCRGESVRSWLETHYSDHVASKVVLRGYLFYPLRHFRSTSEVSRGHDWRFHRNPTSDRSPQPRHNPQVGADHLRGWWAADLEEEFAQRVRANDAVGESRFVVLPKLYWLSPIVAEEDPNDGRVVVKGEQDLHIEDIQAMTLDEIVTFARDHFAISLDSPEAIAKGRLVMPLLVAEIVRCRPDDIEYNAGEQRWKELSRGFLLDPKSWDPLPLCQDAVRFKRTSDEEQAAQGREYEGRRQWVNDGVIKPTDQEAELARRKKLHSFSNVENLTPEQMSDELLAILASEQKQYLHSNLKQSVQTAFIRSTTRIALGSESAFLLQSLRYLLLRRQQDHEESKTIQRVSHLLLDAFEGRSTSDEARGSLPGFVRLFQEVVRDETRWNYINVSLRAIDTVRPRSDTENSFFHDIPVDAFSSALQLLLAQRIPRWNAVAVEILRVVYSRSTDNESADARRSVLDTLIAQQDWKNAEQLVVHCASTDVPILLGLYKQFSARNMTKPMKRLRRLFALCQGNGNLLLMDGRMSRPLGIQHALGPPLDAEANRLAIASEIAPLQWTLVNTPHQVNEVQQKLLSLLESPKRQPIIVGLDCEWRPQFLVRENASKKTDAEDDLAAFELPVGEDEGVSVYQLAVEDHVYVVDVQVLGTAAMAPLASIWNAERGAFILVGFCVSGDLRRLNHSFPLLLREPSTDHRLLVELKQVALYRQLPASSWGLSQLYEACFGEQVDKEEQCSDWGLRPLSESQLEYAARDAYVVRNIARHLLADVVALDNDLVGYVQRFSVVTGIDRAGGIEAEAELGRWITMLEPLNESHVQAALIELGLATIAHSFFSAEKDLWENQARLPQGLVVKTIAIVLRRGGHVATRRDLVHYVAVVLHVDKSIDMAVLARHLSVQEDDLQLADRETLLRVFGFTRGSIGPIGLREKDAVHVVLDASLLQETAVLPGAGREDLTYAIEPHVLRESVHASAVHLTT